VCGSMVLSEIPEMPTMPGGMPMPEGMQLPGGLVVEGGMPPGGSPEGLGDMSMIS